MGDRGERGDRGGRSDGKADVRWFLARERTALSRMRFSLGFSLAAIALAVLAPPQVPTLLVVVLGGLCAIAGLVAAVATVRS